MKGIGLVFAGGGGKGSYEIGVWKYLHELGFDQYVRAVSGTSVGALNAALFAGSSFEIAEDLWKNINKEKILSPKELSIEDVTKYLALLGFHFTGPIGKAIESVTSVVVSDAALGMSMVGQYLLKRISSDYFFSRTGLIELIKEGINFSQLQCSDIPCYVTCLKCSPVSVERFELRNYVESDIVKLLLASSAIPVVFPNEEFEGEQYCDGGVPFIGDNVPIQPIYELGVEHIFVIHLSQDSLIDKEKYSNSRIIEIMPSVDLGNALTGTLDFTPDGSEKRMEQGYEDAKRILKPMAEMLMMNAANQAMLREAQEKMKVFGQKKDNLIKKEEQIKAEMENDGFNELYNNLMRGK